MYQEEEMIEPGLSNEFVANLPMMIESLTRRVEGLEGRERNPLEPWEMDEAAVLRHHNGKLIDLIREKDRELEWLRSRVQMMEAGYRAVASVQARLDANERQIGEHRCAGIGTNIGTGQRGSL